MPSTRVRACMTAATEGLDGREYSHEAADAVGPGSPSRGLHAAARGGAQQVATPSCVYANSAMSSSMCYVAGPTSPRRAGTPALLQSPASASCGPDITTPSATCRAAKLNEQDLYKTLSENRAVILHTMKLLAQRDPSELGRAAAVCRLWRDVSRTPALWHTALEREHQQASAPSSSMGSHGDGGTAGGGAGGGSGTSGSRSPGCSTPAAAAVAVEAAPQLLPPELLQPSHDAISTPS